MGYFANVLEWKDQEVQPEMFDDLYVSADRIDEWPEAARQLWNRLVDPDEEGCWLSRSDTESLALAGVPRVDIDWTCPDLNEEWEEETYKSFVRPAPAYLVAAMRCRWDGASGYKIVPCIRDAFERRYEVTMWPTGVSPQGKTLRLREASHDVPMGADTYVIALTDKEKAWLEDEGLFSERGQAWLSHCVKAVRDLT